MWRWIQSLPYRLPWLSVRLPRRRQKRTVRRISNMGDFVQLLIFILMGLIILGAVIVSIWK